MGRKAKAAVASEAKPIILTLTDDKGSHARIGIDAATLKFRPSVELHERRNGNASAPCVLYATGDDVKLGGMTGRLSLSFVTTIPDAKEAGIKLLAAQAKAAPVKVRKMTFAELAANGWEE